MIDRTRPEEGGILAAAAIGGEGPPSARAFLPLLATDVFIVVFALWTIGCHGLVVLGATAQSLDIVAGALACAVAVCTVLLWLRPAGLIAHGRDALVEPALIPFEVPSSWRWGYACALGLVVCAWLLTRSFELVWVLSAFALCLALAKFGHGSGQTEHGNASMAVTRSQLRLLVVAGLACATLSLLVHRPRTDDAFYLNVALSVVDHPDELLLGFNQLHGPASDVLGPQPMFFPYRIHSFEVLVGWLARTSGIDVVVMEHLVVATCLAALVPLALMRLLRVLLPQRWTLALIVVLAFYMIEGSAPRGYSNQALVRLFHGKSAMLTLMTPLICAHALRFAARPNLRRWLLLALSQVAALGLSSTAIWWAPTLALVSAVAGTPSLRRLPRVGSLALMSTLYVLAVGVWVKVEMLGGVMESGPSVASAIAETPELVGDSGASLLGYAIPIVLGPEQTAIALLSVLALACITARQRVVAALFGLLMLALVLFFANPWLAPHIASNLTGVLAYQRIFWLLPIPVALGVAHVQGLAWLESLVRKRLAALCATGLLIAFFMSSTTRTVLGSENHAKIRFPPSVKLWKHAQLVAESVCDLAPTGSYVLAPEAVMQQLGTRSGCGYPVLAGERWISVSADERDRRRRLVAFVSDKREVQPDEVRWFVESLGRYHVDVVVLSKRAMRIGHKKALLRWAGYERVAEIDWDHLWARTSDQAKLAHRQVAAFVCSRSQRGSRVIAPFGVLRAIGANGCNRPVVDPARRGNAIGPADFDLLRLETVLQTARELDAEDQTWLRQALHAFAVRVVVVKKYAMRNRSLKSVLRKAGFVNKGLLERHHIYVKK